MVENRLAKTFSLGQPMQPQTVFRWACLILTAVFLAGCSSGPQKGEVTGTVKVDGKPIERGSISFYPVDGKGQTAGGPITGGTYSVKDVTAGAMKVEVRMPVVVGKKKDYDAPGGKWYPVEDEALPDKYNNQTELRFDVKPGKNEKNWDLKKQ